MAKHVNLEFSLLKDKNVLMMFVYSDGEILSTDGLTFQNQIVSLPNHISSIFTGGKAHIKVE